MDCPVCDKPLIVVEHRGIELDWCPSCRGLWFDAGELELLAEESGRRLSPAEITATGSLVRDAPPRDCPRCGGKMAVRQLALEEPLAVDLCPKGHGVWLDRGELGTLLRGLPCSPAGPAAEVASFLADVFPTGGDADPPGRSSPG